MCSMMPCMGQAPGSVGVLPKWLVGPNLLHQSAVLRPAHSDHAKLVCCKLECYPRIPWCWPWLTPVQPTHLEAGQDAVDAVAIIAGQVVLPIVAHAF